MGDRWNRRKNKLFGGVNPRPGRMSDRYTLLGVGDPTLYTDLNVNVDIGGGSGDGTIPSGFPPPVPVPPPFDLPVGMPANPDDKLPIFFWQRVAAPAAGSNWLYVHKDYEFPVLVRRIFYCLITSAVATARITLISAKDTGGQRVMVWYPTTTQAASTTTFYQFADNHWLATVSVNAAFGGPPVQPSIRLSSLPTIVLEKNFSIGTEFNDGIVSNSPEAGDVFSGIGLLLQRADR